MSTRVNSEKRRVKGHLFSLTTSTKTYIVRHYVVAWISTPFILFYLDVTTQNKTEILLGKDLDKLLPVPPWLRVFIKLFHVFSQEDLLMEVLVEVTIPLHFQPVQVVRRQNLIFVFVLADRNLIFGGGHVGWACVYRMEQQENADAESQEVSGPHIPPNSHGWYWT